MPVKLTKFYDFTMPVVLA